MLSTATLEEKAAENRSSHFTHAKKRKLQHQWSTIAPTSINRRRVPSMLSDEDENNEDNEESVGTRSLYNEFGKHPSQKMNSRILPSTTGLNRSNITVGVAEQAAELQSIERREDSSRECLNIKLDVQCLQI